MAFRLIIDIITYHHKLKHSPVLAVWKGPSILAVYFRIPVRVKFQYICYSNIGKVFLSTRQHHYLSPLFYTTQLLCYQLLLISKL